MRKIKDISEKEMIAVFLKGELHSDRWGGTIKKLLEDEHLSTNIIDSPDFDRIDENYFRKKILAQFRGFDKNESLFHTFPKDVTWVRASITKEELESVLYIKWEYWLTLTNGSRLPHDGVKTILENPENEETKRFWKVAESIKAGTQFPELILVAKDENSPLVVLEGQVRLTAYCMVPDYIPKEMEVIVGYSKHMDQWDNY